MKKMLAVLVVLGLLGCDKPLQRTVATLNPYPASYLRTLEVVNAVLARHFPSVYVDKAHGVVDASSVVRANIYSKYRTRAMARIYEVARGAYGVEVRVTNELEVSEPSLQGLGQPGYDWRAVGFDRIAEANLMAELEAQLTGKTAAPPQGPSYVMFKEPKTSGRPPAPKPQSSLQMPAPAAPASVAPAQHEATPRPDATTPPKSVNARLFEQYLAMGDLCLQRHELDKALLEYQRATIAAPRNPIGHLSLAGAWTALRRYDAAAAALREAAAVGDKHPLPATEVTRLRGPAEDLSERLLVLRGLCKQKPGDVDALLLLAYHYFLAGRMDEARAAIGELNKAQPKDTAAQQYLAQQMNGLRS